MRSPSLREGGGGWAIRHELQLKPGLWTRQAQVCLPRPQGCSQLTGLGGLQTGQRGSWAAGAACAASPPLSTSRLGPGPPQGPETPLQA